MKTLIVGDIHANWNALDHLLEEERPDIILQVGDFGYWPRLLPYPFPIKNGDTKIYFCDGNHEDHWSLENVKLNPEIQPNIFYQKRGSTLTLPDGRNVLFMGGAFSIDKATRTIGVDWFPEETITDVDLSKLSNEKIDIVISHTCPETFIPDLGKKVWPGMEDPSCKALDYVLERYHPDLWFFGHWHFFKQGSYMNTNWTLLNLLGDGDSVISI